jgi:hypothetical protein
LLTDDVERLVFQQQKRTKQLLDSVVSVMRNCEELLNNGVSASERKVKQVLNGGVSDIDEEWGTVVFWE